MKVTIDLDKLLEAGEITTDEYDKFSRLAARGTATLAFNILIGFGVVAVSGGALALVPAAATAVLLGVLVCAAGIALIQLRREHWTVLAHICVLTGALLFGGGMIITREGSVDAFLLVAAAFTGAGLMARSSLLTVLAVLALSSCIGARTGYFEASYFLGIEAPAMTILLFTLFSTMIFTISKRLPPDYRPLAVNAARTGAFLVNFGFWIGSLFGDTPVEGAVSVPDWVFGALWAVALLAAAIWGWMGNRRWMLNTAAVFGGIHFYTQWFERLDASAGTVMVAGLLALAAAFVLRALNLRMAKTA